MNRPWIPDGMERAYLALLRSEADAPRLPPPPAPGAMCSRDWCLSQADEASFSDVITVRRHVHRDGGVYDMVTSTERVPTLCTIHRKHPSFRPGPFRGRNPWTLKVNIPPSLWRRAS